MNLFSFITGLFEPVTNLVDEVFTSQEEKNDFKKKMAELEAQQAGKVLEYQKQILSERASIIQGEVSGNWLQRSWRPLLMLSFGFIIIYQYFIAPIFGIAEIELPDRFWSLLEIGIGGYLVGRSVEKVAPQLADAKTKQKQMHIDGDVAKAKVVKETEIHKACNEAQNKAPAQSNKIKNSERLSRREQRLQRGKERREARRKKREENK